MILGEKEPLISVNSLKNKLLESYQKIKIFGVVPILFTDILTGNQTRQMVYICEHASSLLLSYEACVDLKYVSHDFDMYQQKQ